MYRFITSTYTRFLFLVLAISIASQPAFTQPINNGTGSISIPSAAAMNYGRQAEIATNHYTGVASYQLPLCTVNDAAVSHSIGITYNSAFRVGEIASNIGLGFHLAAGGLVTRTIQGIEDDKDEDGIKGWYLESNISATNKRIVEGKVDAESDIYTISAGSLILKFVFDKDGNVVTMPKSDVSVKPLYTSGRFFGFTVKTSNGMTYHFGQHPATGEKAYEYTKINEVTQLTSWYLMRIESFDSQQAIDFEYIENKYRFFSNPSCTKLGYKSNGRIEYEEECFEGSQEKIDIQIEGQIINKIISPTKTVSFRYFEREDIGELGYFVNIEKGINRIEIQNGDDYCYEYILTQDYLEASDSDLFQDKRLQLKAVHKQACDDPSLSEPAYEFEYYSYIKNGKSFYPGMLDKNQDHWGYYNYRYDQSTPTDNNDFEDMIPTTGALIPNGGSFINIQSQVERTPYFNAQKIGALKRITLPTGGYTEIEYEPNKYVKKGGSEVSKLQLASCDCICGGVRKKDQSLTITEQLLKTGSWNLCIEPFIDNTDCTGYRTAINEARINVYDETSQLCGSFAFDSEVARCQSGNLNGLFKIIKGKKLEVGKSYTFEVQSTNAKAYLSISHLTDAANQIAGGLRVKKTTTYDGSLNKNNEEDHSNDIIRMIEYTRADDPTLSSGILFSLPKYAITLNNYTVLFQSESVVPLAGFEGYHMGYTNVVVHHNGNGREQFQFTHEENNLPDWLTESPYGNYPIKSQQQFNSNYDSRYIYDSYPIAPSQLRVSNGVLEQQATFENDIAITSSSTTKNDGDHYQFSSENRKVIKLSVSNGSTNLKSIYFNNRYKPRTGIYRPKQVVTTKDGVTSTISYEYHPTIIATTATEFENSDEKVTRQETFYSVDHGGWAIKDYFIRHNLLALALKSDLYVDGEMLGGQLTAFALYDEMGENPDLAPIITLSGTMRPYQTWRWERTWKDNILQEGNWDLQSAINSYTPSGLPTSVQSPGWDEQTFQYNDQKLLEEERFLDFVNTYEYYDNSSLLKKKTYVDGTSSTVSYDGLMRTDTVRDDCKNIITTYDYQYKIEDKALNATSTTTTYPSSEHSDLTQLTSHNYLDGLGRPIATVLQNQAPDAAHDITQTVAYDNQGRAFKKYEPKQLDNNNGAYQAPQIDWPFTLTEYYPSPLSRPFKTTPPDWHPTTYTYGSNDTEDAVKKELLENTEDVYADNLLFKQTTIDGNGHKSIQFTDKKGRSILSRRTDGQETATLHYDTYYAYDDKDRQIMALPPGTTSSMSDLIFENEYDQEDRVIKQKVPGKAVMLSRYDLKDQLVAQQDGYLRNLNQWYSHNFDPYGRELLSGFYTEILPEELTDGLVPSEVLTENIYSTVPHEIGKVKTTKTKILDGNDNWLQVTNNYTNCGLLEEQISNNHINLAVDSETSFFNYDGADNPITTTYEHLAHSNNQTITTTQTYDHAGRSRLSLFAWDSQNEIQTSERQYDYKNQLTSLYQGGTGLTGNLAYLQKIDFSYHENGLLYQINGDLTGTQTALMTCPAALPQPSIPDVSSYDNKDLFFLALSYDQPFAGTSAMEQKNGNITGVKWQTRGREQQGFSLQYDLYNRLTNADYFDINSEGVLDETGIYDVSLTYDQRGNISSLSRYGLNPTATCFEPALIDQLSYDYGTPNTTNQLQKVSDTAPCPNNKHVSQTVDYTSIHAAQEIVSGNNALTLNANITYQAGQSVSLLPGFQVTAGTQFLANIADCPTMGFETGGYTQMNSNPNQYDINGNQKVDAQKETITTYNHLDLPTVIQFPDGKNINFTYDAAGTLLTKELKDVDGTTIETRDYIGGIEYVNGQIESIYHDQGRLHYINGTPRMEYTMVDHLGNTRLAYTDLNGNGFIETPIEILDEVHYYPNGLKMEGPWMNESKYRYGYNGIEELTDFGLNLNHATYRLLDPALGKWGQIDPAVSSYMNLSPYNSMLNSPMVHNDPNGDDPLLLGAAIGLVSNGIGNIANGQNFFKGGLQAAFFGALGGGISSTIGTAAGGISNGLARGAFQAGAHAISGGGLSVAQGGNFLHGAAAGGISSGVGSGIGALGGDGFAQWLGGGLSGGIGSSISGGSFWNGVGQGLITGGLNHAAHGVANAISSENVNCPPCVIKRMGELIAEGTDPDMAYAKAFWEVEIVPALEIGGYAFDILSGPSGEGVAFSAFLRGKGIWKTFKLPGRKTGKLKVKLLKKDDLKTDLSKLTTSRGKPISPKITPVAKSRWAKFMELFGNFDDPRF